MAKPDRKPDPDFEPDYDTADPDYDEPAQASSESTADPNYDEGQPVNYDADFSDPDAREASQEWYARKQK